MISVCATALGCGPQHAMMPAPLAYRARGAAAFASVPVQCRTTCVPVFYATNRVPGAGDECGATYQCERCERVRLGTAAVRIGPESWDWDALVRATVDGDQPYMTLTRVEECGGLGAAGAGDRFAAQINETLARCTQKDVFIYIPGINLAFGMVLQRVAEFSHYLGREGAVVAFAWPAHADPFSYNTDRKCAANSVPEFLSLVRLLRERTDAQCIHLLTSSAGAPVVSGALDALQDAKEREKFAKWPVFGQVIYAASDQPTEAFFEMIAAGHAEACEHMTVYASSNDLGLVLSRYFGSGNRTIGRLPASMTNEEAALLRSHADRITVVDVTHAVEQAGRGDVWAHRYWYANAWVSGDMIAVLRHGRAARERGLVPTHDGALWAFPQGYATEIGVQGP